MSTVRVTSAKPAESTPTETVVVTTAEPQTTDRAAPKPAEFRKDMLKLLRQQKQLFAQASEVDRCKWTKTDFPTYKDPESEEVVQITPQVMRVLRRTFEQKLLDMCKQYESAYSKKRRRPVDASRRSKGFTYPVMMTDEGALARFFLEKISARVTPEQRAELNKISEARKGFLCNISATTLHAIYTRLYPEVLGYKVPGTDVPNQSYLSLEKDQDLRKVFDDYLNESENHLKADGESKLKELRSKGETAKADELERKLRTRVPLTTAFQFTTYQKILSLLMIRHTSDESTLDDEHRPIPAKLDPSKNKVLASAVESEYVILKDLLKSVQTSTQKPTVVKRRGALKVTSGTDSVTTALAKASTS